jgi:hypothetical protein
MSHLDLFHNHNYNRVYIINSSYMSLSCGKGIIMNSKGVRAASFGALSGAIFFVGLAIAIVSGHFLPIFFLTLGLSALVGALSSGNRQGNYGGFQGFVFFLGLTICSIFGWWPWIFVTFGVSAVLGGLTSAIPKGSKQTCAQPQPLYQPSSAQTEQIYQPYQEGYQPVQPAAIYEEGGQLHQYQPGVPQPDYETPQAQYPQQMPPQ